MSRWEGRDHAADWLASETRKPGSGVTARTPRPARESLYSFDLERSGVSTSLPVGVDDDRQDDAASVLAKVMDLLLSRLSPRQREALELVAVAGLTFGAAAQSMGVSKATLYAHYRDAVGRMKKLIVEQPWAEAIIMSWLEDKPEGLGATAPTDRKLPDLNDPSN